MCAAGGGKTTRIVTEALAEDCRSVIVTYTRNNETEIYRKFYSLTPSIPPRTEVMTWFSFLLRELARPYRPALHNQRIKNIQFIEGRSVQKVAESNVAAHYFAGGNLIYEDKISKFVFACNAKTDGAVMRRLAQRFDHIYIDEIQDMAGWDLEIIELILRAGIKLSLVGDHRQATFRTNDSNKNSGYSGAQIVKKFQEWDKAGLAALSYEQHTHRCHQHIATLGDGFYPNEPPTKSLNATITGHDGVFTVASMHVPHYVTIYSPQILRYDRRTTCMDLPALNFGESKGQTFDRVLIFPHGGAQKWLASGHLKHVEKSAAKMYVGATRARYSLAFVFDAVAALPGFQNYVGPA